MKKIIITIAAAFFFGLTGCNLFIPDEYMLNVDREFIVDGYIMSELDSVVQEQKNAIVIKPGGRTAMRSVELTQYTLEFTTEIRRGSGLNFYFRTTKHDFPAKKGIRFRYALDGCSALEDGVTIASVDSITASIGQAKKIQIKNDGVYYQIIADCDTVYSGRSEKPGTEWIIIETLDDTEAYLYGINFADILDRNPF